MRERRPCPSCSVVAGLARRGKSRRRMVRIVGRCILALMTGIAIRGSPRVLPPYMAARTGRARMRPRKCKGGLGVIEARRYPSRCAVAHLAIFRQTRTLMVRIPRGIVRAEMACHTALIETVINPARMARRTAQRRM